MNYIYGYILLINFLINVDSFGQSLHEIHDSTGRYSNFEAEFLVEKVLLDHFIEGFIILEGEFKSLDIKGSDSFSIGSKVQIIFNNYWFNDTLPTRETMKLVVCNYNSAHYIRTPSGSTIAYSSHYSDPNRCFLSIYQKDNERSFLRICPSAGLPLLLCADYLN